ncbi:EcoAI/FtnUII family type I restriction enzme subunit R [Microbacterium foliorum]|uniref:EcoAI/FtnUII family type I restriction enzme subunit R n=1 Tax=Microbacterium foliorum TaxID=104336 RepID=UPI0028D6DEEC|nr:DEAD/DEAH box helicase family protein [Microbacterium foliorum]
MPSNLTEQETRSRLITPALIAAGWNLHTQIREDFALTAGRIVVGRARDSRQRPKRVDYVLEIQPNVPLAVIEAKDSSHAAGAGMQQALEYARMLDVPFVFSTNGIEILMHDKTSQSGPIERILTPDEMPSPDDLWTRYLAWRGIETPARALVEEEYFATTGAKSLRYYQSAAVNRATEAIAAGQRRLLLVMATGTGKTLTAFHLMWRLRAAGRARRILFLVDRNVLADQALVNDFQAFGSIMTKVSGGSIDKSYEVYLALYQALTTPGDAPDLYTQFTPDFFDLVIVDECHRGSAAEDSTWRGVLEYFQSAIQIGLTATPKETAEISSSGYFGDPVYTYSLRDGIDDGFLAPFTVRRIDLDKDLGGWRPTLGQVDRFGQEVPDRTYMSRDYDRSVILDRRSPVVASVISDFLASRDRFAKTIVFCEDVDHAERMRQELVNASADLVTNYNKYVARITGDSEYGAIDLEAFMDPSSAFPVIATTSKLLSTGVDVPTCKVIVLDQTINSMTEFKQIIGRGTRVREDLGKTSFTILDFRGATTLFADPAFDGEPAEIVDDDGSQEPDDGLAPGAREGDDPSGGRSRYFVDGVEVSVLQERVQYLDAAGKLITEALPAYVGAQIREKFPVAEDFRRFWLSSRKKSALEELVEQGILLPALVNESGPEYDAYDLAMWSAYGKERQTRVERADRVRDTVRVSEAPSIMESVLRALIKVYESEGPAEMEDVQILKLRPIAEIGTAVEVIGAFGGRRGYDTAVTKLTEEIYAS